jgi:hypothetical protein
MPVSRSCKQQSFPACSKQVNLLLTLVNLLKVIFVSFDLTSRSAECVSLEPLTIFVRWDGA